MTDRATKIKLEDTLEDLINPATEDKQDDEIDLLNLILTGVIGIPSIYARLDCTNQPFTGAGVFNPPDGTADPLFQVQTTGVNQYGWDAGTLDLTGIGYGKYATLIARSNGALSDGTGVVEGSLVVGNGVAGYFGHGFIFLDDATLAYMSITADWNWDGLGGDRLKCNDDLFVDDELRAKFLTVGDGTNPNPYIKFDGTASDPTITFVEADESLKPSIKTNMITKGLWFDTHNAGEYPSYGGKISLYGDRFESNNGYLIGVESNAVYMQSPFAFTWYIGVQPSLVEGGQIGYSMRLNATGLEVVGDYLGTSFTIGANTLTTSEWAFLDGLDQALKTTDDVTFDDVTVSGELKGCRQQITGGNQAAVAANAYQIMGVGGTKAFTSTFGWVMAHAGSIISVTTILNITIETAQGDIVVQSRINDAVKLSVTVNSGGAGAAVKKGVATQARGAQTFAQGDLIQIYTKLDTNTFVGTITGIATIVEYQYDA